jgi:hypothetical protein
MEEVMDSNNRSLRNQFIRWMSLMAFLFCAIFPQIGLCDCRVCPCTSQVAEPCCSAAPCCLPVSEFDHSDNDCFCSCAKVVVSATVTGWALSSEYLQGLSISDHGLPTVANFAEYLAPPSIVEKLPIYRLTVRLQI